MTDADRRQRVITSTPHLSPEEIATRSFGTKVRGFAEAEVRSFLRRVSDELAASLERERELADALDASEEQLRQPRPLSEQELLDALGEETARLLRSAREAADDIRHKTEDRSAQLIEEAQATADRIRGEAEEVLTRRGAEAEARAKELLADAEARVRDVCDAATVEAESIVEAARRQGREMLDEAKAARERVLGDLVRRRALLAAQIEELRGGRDRLLDAYRTVKRTFLDATEALTQVEVRAASDRSTASEPVDIEAEIAAEIAALDGSQPAGADTADGSDAPAPIVDLAAAEAAEEPLDNAGPAALPDVDSLFARLRAGQTDTPGVPSPGAASAAESGSVATVAADVATIPAAEASSDNDVAAVDVATDEEEPVGFTTAEWRVVRARAIDPLLSPLLKRTKRTAQDDQNALLDAVRRHKGRPTAEQVLPDLEALLATWGAVLHDAIDEAYRAGCEAAGGDRARAGEDLIREAAEAIVAPLRLRVTVAIDAGDEGDTGGLVERIGARYREWKNQSLEGALAEVLAFAWSRGVYDAVPDGAVLRWVPFEEGGCSDCDDNALEPTVKGEHFPTGQARPPAHPGCRCLLAPDAILNTSTAAR